MVDRNLKIVEFLYNKWIGKVKNNSAFANEHNIDEKTVRLIKEKKNYRTSIDTIINICEAKNINLSQFFREVEEMFPEAKINER
jgi:DNA-binding Xre family transcriptional regulator